MAWRAAKRVLTIEEVRPCRRAGAAWRWDHKLHMRVMQYETVVVVVVVVVSRLMVGTSAFAAFGRDT